MIPFVERKLPDHAHVEALLAASARSGVWSNFGPTASRLEARLAEILALPPHRRVVACASGTVALHALVLLHEHLAGRPLRWVVSAFTFRCQLQGALAEARVVDCDVDGMLDLDAVAALDVHAYDGIVVTDLFGTTTASTRYADLASSRGKVLLFDAATCVGVRSASEAVGARGDGEALSFHHTKPFGFGEGGCAVVPRALEDTFRSLVNFGLYRGIDTGERSLNGKMSDVAAAFVLDRLRHFDAVRAAHRDQFARIAALARSRGWQVLTAGEGSGAIPNLVPLVAPRPVALEELGQTPVMLHKYYTPLARLPGAERLHSHIVCLPCHRGVEAVGDESLGALLARLPP